MACQPTRIAFFADLHLHNWGEFAKTIVVNDKPINSRLHDQIQTLRKSFRAAAHKGCSHVVVLGDVFHLRGQIPTDVMQYVYDLFSWGKDELGLNFIIMTGNHDQADKAGQIHSVYALQGVAQIVDTPLMVEVNNVNLWMIPYTASHEDLLHCVHRTDIDPDDGHSNIMCLHAGIDGSIVGAVEYRIKDPITVDDLPTDQFDQILLGHYHKPQTLAKNVRYVGSPVQHTRSEMGDIKRWIMWDDGQIRSIKTSGKQFYTLDSSDMEGITSLDPGYYDVTINEDQDVGPVLKELYALEGAAECTFKIAHKKKTSTKKARIKVDAATTDDVLLKRYLKHRMGHPGTIPSLHEVGMDYLRRATNDQAAKTSLLFNQLSVHNFLSIESANLNLLRPGSVVAVIGENEDAEGFESNGAGKSALLPESIYWCLFGQTARGVPADAVVNNIKKRDCHVRLSLVCDDTHIAVERYRKHSELGTGMSLFVDGKDISQGKVSDTEKLLWQMLGLDYTTFSSVVAFSPSNLQFVSSTDASQKQVLDSILQTSRFSAALSLVKDDVKAFKTSRQELVEDLRTVEGREETLNSNLAEYRTASDQFQENEAKRKKDLQSTLNTEQDVLSTLKKDLQTAVEAIAQHQERMDALEIPDAAEILEEQAKLNRNLGSLQATAKQCRRNRDDVQEQLEAATEQAGKPCPKCGQPVTNTAKLMAQLSSERSKHIQDMEAAQTKVQQVQERLGQIASALQAYNEALELQQEMQTTMQTLERKRNSAGSRVTVCEGTIRSLKSNLTQERQNEYATKLIPAAKAKLKEIKQAKDKIKQDIEELDQKLELSNFWVEGFGNAGVKSFLFDQIIPELTEFANYYVDRLAGDSIKIEFATHSEGASKDKFTIKAWNSEGSDIYAGNSSGERRRIDLCVMLALFRVANNRVKMSLLLMDEVFDTLDAVGIENVVGVLDDLARDLDLTIFVTSHTSLSNMLHESITVRKSQGLATLVEDGDVRA